MLGRSDLEQLRGEPIVAYDGDVNDIPCRETSDVGELCKRPLVSVHMVTYNHEPYIRSAIEGVVAQRANFEFELVIGEDCSTDRTREICLEYQRRYPAIVRVLWSEENLYQHPHHSGGNGQRVFDRCRGKYIAFCEGDDCWTDPLKLQKQVDAMESHPTVGLCFTSGVNHYVEDGRVTSWVDEQEFCSGLINGATFFRTYLFGYRQKRSWHFQFLMTASVVIRKSVYDEAFVRYPIFRWKLSLADLVWWLGVSSFSDVYYVADRTMVYNRVSTGATGHSNGKLMRDGMLVRLFFADACCTEAILPRYFKKHYLLQLLAGDVGGFTRKAEGVDLVRISCCDPVLKFVSLCVKAGLVGKWNIKWLRRLVMYL